jgi:cyclomaltodextrinase
MSHHQFVHDSTLRFVNPLADGRLIIRLQAPEPRSRHCRLVCRMGEELHELSMQTLLKRDGVAHLGCDLRHHNAPISYAFCLRDGEAGLEWFTPRGLEVSERTPTSWFTFDPRGKVPFQTPDWIKDAIFYQIFCDRFANGDTKNDPENAEPWGNPPSIRNFFGGDLQGALDKLPYLQELGINAIYFTPLFVSASNHKYDTIDYFNVDPHFGDNALLKKLIAECHARGIRVILDAVFNHCSNLHPFFLDVAKNGRDSKYWNWFFVKKWPFPEKFSHRHEALEHYECWWGFHTLPKLNYHNPEVEQYFLNVATFWIKEFGADGWRLDVPNEVPSFFWPKFRNAVRAANPNAYIVGEIWHDASAWLQGDMFDAVMNYRLRNAVFEFFIEKKLNAEGFARELGALLVDYPEQANYAMLNVLDSHDTERLLTICKRKGGAARDFIPAENGDAPAENHAVVAEKDALATMKLCATFQFTAIGAPCVYYGDEIGMEGGKDPDCRRCYPWHKPETHNRELFSFYQKLAAIRKSRAALRRGSFRTLLVDNARELFVFERKQNGETVIVAFNNGASEQRFSLTIPAKSLRNLLADETVSSISITLTGRTGAIFDVPNDR